MSAPPLCKNCGGGLPQHQEGPCWCRTCLEKPTSERCREYVPRPPKTESKEKSGFGKKPPTPPKKAPKSMDADGGEATPPMPALPELGTAERIVLDAVRASQERGCTDSDIALKTELAHHDVIAARSALVSSGMLFDSGQRRRDDKGREYVAWLATQPSEAVSDDDSPPLLVRDDVHVSHEGMKTVLHAGATQIRLSITPGDPVEVATTPNRADPDQDDGPEISTLLIVDGSEDMFLQARDPFITTERIVEMMDDIITPAISALTAVKKDL